MGAASLARERGLASRLIDKVLRRKTWQKIIGLGRGQVSGAKRRAGYYRENKPANQVLRFARQAYEAAPALAAEVHVAHGVLALPAAEMLARTSGGRLVCDAIEIPAFAARRRTSWHPTNIAFLDLAFESYLRRCDAILTVGWALKGELDRLGPPVHVVPNYRAAGELVPSPRLRAWCGLAAGEVLVLAISKITEGLEAVIDSLHLLPDRVHLAVLGRLYPPDYRARIEALVAARGLGRRVHLFDPVPYPELAGTAAGADLGLVVLDPAILNNRISLPNRLFDYMAAGLPVCSPEIPDIVRILREHEMGVVVEPLDAAGWARAITAGLAGKDVLGANARRAAEAMVWSTIEDPLFAALGRPASITFYGFYDLTRNNRTLRMAGSLAARGTAVTICTYSAGPPPPVAAGVRFHLLPPE